MSLLNRISSGLVIHDKFDSAILHPRWQVSPSDESRYSLSEKTGVLRLKHGEPDIFMLFNSPRFDFVMEAEIDYHPIRASDQGGLVAFSDQDTRLELLQYYDPQQGGSQYWNKLRLIRRSDLFEGFGSKDNGKTWELIGTSFLSAPKVGFVLHGIQESQSDTLDVLDFRVYRDTKIHVGNLMPNQRVEVVDESDNVLGSEVCLQDQDHVKVDVTNVVFPLKGKIRLYDATNLLIAESDLLDDMWGGDVFWYGMKLDIEIDGILLREDREHKLGNMQQGTIEKRAFIINSNHVTIPNVKATVMAYSEYFGWQWVDIATDVYGEPGTYQDSIDLGNITAGERVPIWLRILRQPHHQLASLHDYKFRIMFESG